MASELDAAIEKAQRIKELLISKNQAQNSAVKRRKR
jgi:hypothetical protein